MSVVYDWVSVTGAFKKELEVSMRDIFICIETLLWTGRRNPFLCTSKQILPAGFFTPRSTSVADTWCEWPVSHRVSGDVETRVSLDITYLGSSCEANYPE